MSTLLSGLSKRTTTEKLHEAFSQFGEVVNGLLSSSYFVLCFVITVRLLIIDLLLFTARVVTDRQSGYSKGFGFVKYATLEGAEKGIKGMDGQVS